MNDPQAQILESRKNVLSFYHKSYEGLPIAQHAKMDLNKKSRPMKNNIQTWYPRVQKTMFENPHTQIFFHG